MAQWNVGSAANASHPAQAAHNVNRQEQPFGERVFDPNPEHPQKPHVPQDVPET